MAFATWLAHGLTHSAGELFRPFSTSVSRLTSATLPVEAPSAEQLMELALKGWIKESTLEDQLRLSGIYLNVTGNNPQPATISKGADYSALWNQTYWAHQELPTLHELQVLRNRMVLDDAEFAVGMRRRGYYDKETRNILGGLRFDVPGPSDLVRFSVRHVFEPDLIKELGYDQEFNATLDFWHRMQGLQYPIFAGPFAEQYGEFLKEVPLSEQVNLLDYAEKGLPDPTWARAYWWSHWILPSPTQAYEMLFRLRPDRDRRFDPPFAKEFDFTLDQLKLLLRANDYPPQWRGPLAAIAYRVPGIRFMRELLANEVYTPKDINELLLRQGYSPFDAQTLTASLTATVQKGRNKARDAQAKGQAAKYWELGIITDIDYLKMLIDLGFDETEAAQALALARTDRQFKRVSKVITAIKRQLTSGAWDQAKARAELTSYGVIADRAQDYLDDWSIELKVRHRAESGQQAIKLACQGLITVDDLRTRLTNLGYNNNDILAMVGEAELCAATAAARAAAQQARAAKQQQTALRQSQRQAAQAITQARQALSRHGTPAQLRRWYCESSISSAEVFDRLRQLGWPDADIARLIGDCQVRGSTGGGARGGNRGGTTVFARAPASPPATSPGPGE